MEQDLLQGITLEAHVRFAIPSPFSGPRLGEHSHFCQTRARAFSRGRRETPLHLDGRLPGSLTSLSISCGRVGWKAQFVVGMCVVVAIS